MANFAPFKTYILNRLDDLIAQHHLTGPFLDVGCGRGDVSLHLAQRGWPGRAIDISAAAWPLAQATLKDFPLVEVRQEDLDTQTGSYFKTVVMFDVLEHIDQDVEALSTVARLQTSGSFLVLTVPANPATEWRWDDEFYGHVRRYQPAELKILLATCGYTITELWDISFPFFWILRRGFTALKRPPTMTGTALERTQISPVQNAWDMGLISKLLSLTILWLPAFALQKQFRHRPDLGNEIMVLARRV